MSDIYDPYSLTYSERIGIGSDGSAYRGGGGLQNYKVTLTLVSVNPVSRYSLFVLPIDTPPTIDPVQLLSMQLKAAAPDAEWDASNVDRAHELATFLYTRMRIRTLVPLLLEEVVVRRTIEYSTPQVVASSSGDQDHSFVVNVPKSVQSELKGYRFSYEGRPFGYLGEQDRPANELMLKPPNVVAWSAAGHGNVSYVIEPTSTGVAIVPVWGSSSDAGRIRKVAQLVAAFALTIGFPAAGISVANALGGAILGPLASSYPALASVVGNVALSTALNGGNIEAAVKGAALSYVGGTAGSFVGSGISSASGIEALGRIASSATSTLIQGGDVKRAIGLSVIQGGAQFLDTFDAPSSSDVSPIETPSIDTPSFSFDDSSSFGGPGFVFEPTIDWSAPVASTAPIDPAPASSTPFVVASPAVAATSPVTYQNIVATISNAAVQALNAVRAFKNLRSEFVNARARVTTPDGTMTQCGDDGLIRTAGATGTRVSLPPVGVPQATISGNLVVNNGDGTYTLITPAGASSIRRYPANPSSLSTSATSLPSSPTITIGGFSISTPMLLGGAALALVLLSSGGRRVS